MGINRLDESRYLDYLSNVDIVRKELDGMKLLPKEGVWCDMYALPSHNMQTYYAVVYENHGKLKLVYAKPLFYTSHFSKPIRMYCFGNAKKAEKHPDFEGHIIMGIRTL